MKLGYTLSLVVAGLLAFSCSKDSAAPSVNIANAVTLAGPVNSTKNWKLSSISGTLNGGSQQVFTLSSCISDNVFIFSNNANQDFVQNDLTVCNSGDSTVAEKGNWAFTSNGKTLVVEGLWYDDLSQDNVPFCLTANGAFKVVTLTDASLVMTYGYTISQGDVVITVSFTKA